jgi:purine-binding chemotaxis protein CheW
MSSLSSQYGFTRRKRLTQQLIVFRLRREQFALPIQFAYKVIPMVQTYGICQERGVSLARYQNHDILVIDVQRRIFIDSVESTHSFQLLSSNHSVSNASSSTLSNSAQPHLLLTQTSQGELFGIPLEMPPSLQRFPNTAFTPVPDHFLSQGSIRCISALVIPSKNESPIFLLNPNLLIQDPAVWMSSSMLQTPPENVPELPEKINKLLQ